MVLTDLILVQHLDAPTILVGFRKPNGQEAGCCRSLLLSLNAQTMNCDRVYRLGINRSLRSETRKKTQFTLSAVSNTRHRTAHVLTKSTSGVLGIVLEFLMLPATAILRVCAIPLEPGHIQLFPTFQEVRNRERTSNAALK